MSDTIIQAALLKAFETLGKSAVFMPGDYDPVDCVVDLVKGAQIVEGGYDAPIVSRMFTIEYLLDQLGRDPQPGESFIVGEDEWVVEGPFEDPDSNDMYTGRVIVTRKDV